MTDDSIASEVACRAEGTIGPRGPEDEAEWKPGGEPPGGRLSTRPAHPRPSSRVAREPGVGAEVTRADGLPVGLERVAGRLARLARLRDVQDIGSRREERIHAQPVTPSRQQPPQFPYLDDVEAG